MNRLILSAVAVTAVVLLVNLVAVAADPDKTPATVPVEITSHREGAEVDESEELEARLIQKDCWPLVVIRPILRDEPWHVQAPIETINSKNKMFSVPLVFGDKTSRGVRFKLCIILLKDEAEARKYKQGSTMTTLPAGVPHTDPIVVRRK